MLLMVFVLMFALIQMLSRLMFVSWKNNRDKKHGKGKHIFSASSSSFDHLPNCYDHESQFKQKSEAVSLFARNSLWCISYVKELIYFWPGNHVFDFLFRSWASSSEHSSLPDFDSHRHRNFYRWEQVKVSNQNENAIHLIALEDNYFRFNERGLVWEWKLMSFSYTGSSFHPRFFSSTSFS